MSDDKPTPRATRFPATRGRPKPPGTDVKLFWLATFVVLGVMIAADIPNEIVRWKHAAAIVAREAEDKEGAYDQLSAAYQSRLEHADYVRWQLAWCDEDGKYEEALKLQNKLMEGGRPNWENLERRSGLLMKVGRFSEAIEDCLEIDRLSRSSGDPPRGRALNQLAYCRAVGGIELEAAEREIEQSVAGARAELALREQAVARAHAWNWWNANERYVRLLRAQMGLAGCLDTRGFIRFKLGKLEGAKEDLNESLKWEARVKSDIMPRDAKRERRYRDFAAEKARLDRNTAVLYYHRALILKKLGDVQGFTRDFLQARRLLGREPDETLF